LSAEADALCGASYGERSDERTNQRYDTRQIGSTLNTSRCASAYAITASVGRRVRGASGSRRLALGRLTLVLLTTAIGLGDLVRVGDVRSSSGWFQAL
jgi:hypothetical protein